MRTRYFGWEYVFEHIWNNADPDGLWDGDAASMAAEFGVTEDEAHDVIAELCNRRHIEKVYSGTYAITEWRERERDQSGEEELRP
jgi:hypothetical protein